MAGSLRDQLLKAGLVDKNKVQTLKQERHKKRKTLSKTAKANVEPTPAQRHMAEKTARDRDINRKGQSKRERRAILAQVRQIVETHRIERADAQIGFQFLENKKIRKILVTPVLHDQLVKGLIVIVRYKQGYELVGKAVAEKISQRDPSFVVTLESDTVQETKVEDCYAQYKVPDDLVW